jgi:hypothetical protein
MSPVHGPPGRPGHDGRPDIIRIGPGGPGRLENAPHGHVVAEIHFAFFQGPGNRGGALGLRRAGQGDVPLAGEESGGGIHADPSGAGNIDFGPGVQVGEVGLRPGRPVQGLDVLGQLDEITRDETGGQAQVAQDVDHQPGRIPAGAASQGEGLFAALHIGLHANEVFDGLAQLLVEVHEKIDGGPGAAVDGGQVGLELFTGRLACQVRPEVRLQRGFVAEGKGFGIGFEEEIEGVDDDHVGHEVDLHFKPVGFFREHQPAQVIAERVLLPVDEMRFGGHRHGVAQDRGPAMGGRPQANDLGGKGDTPVIMVGCLVVQGNMDSHG